jgi:type II secretory pathway component PulK
MNRQRGGILILVLFVLIVLSFVAVSFAYRTGLENRDSSLLLIRTKLRLVSESALAIALAALAQNTNDFDHFAESWHTHEPLSVSGYLADWAPGEKGDPPAYLTDYFIIDEQSKLHVKYASSVALQKLGLNAVQIDSLFDWMDADDNPSPQGAESSYYQKLATPYLAKNKPMELLEELLLIRGFTPADYYGEDANHNRILDPEENDGPLNPPMDDADGRLKLGLVDLLTCVGDGKININTAPAEVLRTLPISDKAVDQIIAFRAFDASSRGKLEDHVFKQPGDIDALQGLEDAERDVLKAACVFKSTHFRIFMRSRHPLSSATHQAQALVQMTEQGPKLLTWQVGW